MGADQGLTHVFYDGRCGLCSGAVRFVARQDRAGGIRFAPLGGATFGRLISGVERPGLPDSLLVLTPEGDLLIRSKAVIHLSSRMGQPWRMLGGLLAWVPTRLGDAVYDGVVRLRPAGRACSTNGFRSDERFVP